VKGNKENDKDGMKKKYEERNKMEMELNKLRRRNEKDTKKKKACKVRKQMEVVVENQENSNEGMKRKLQRENKMKNKEIED
jgi:hypothetical protein